MAKPQAPLFGFGASGQLGKALVYGKWKGIDVARRYVVPANPNTSGQSTQRGYMRSAVADWHDTTNPLTGVDKAAWNRYAGALPAPMSGFNAYCRAAIDAAIAYSAAFKHFYLLANVVLTHNAFVADIHDSAGGTLTVTVHIGNTKTFFPVTKTDAQVAGLTSFASVDTTFAAGDTVYYWFDVPTGATYKRSGLYTGVLT